MRHPWRIWGWLLPVLALLGGAGCHRQPGTRPAPVLPPAVVSLEPVVAGTHTASEEIVGTVRPRLRASLEARISGRIEALPVVPGQAVKTGTLLAQVDARETQARLDQALAVREQAERDLKRFSALLAERAITQQEYDTVEARQRIAQAAVREAEATVAYTRITAPFDGVITRKLADLGDLAGPGKAILELEDPTALRLETDVPETLVDRIKPGSTLPVRLAAATNDVAGTVSEIAPAADPGSRTFRVKLDLPQTPGLRAGQFGRVAVPLGEAMILRLPSGALVTRGQMQMVFVVTNGVAQMRLVKVGRTSPGEVELLSGVEAGETVAVEGAQRLLDGQPVQAR
jgi:RND family efflux transporter MFP subunit